MGSFCTCYTEEFISPSCFKDVVSILFLPFRPGGSDRQKDYGNVFGKLLGRLISGKYFVGVVAQIRYTNGCLTGCTFDYEDNDDHVGPRITNIGFLSCQPSPLISSRFPTLTANASAVLQVTGAGVTFVTDYLLEDHKYVYHH